jgi:site-specific DNA recombinase
VTLRRVDPTPKTGNRIGTNTLNSSQHPGRALGYVRRSKESSARTVSIEDQRARIADYCQTQGWQLIEIVTDDGVSGGRRERLARLAERVKATGVTFVVVYNLDRFCRDVAGMLDTLRAYARRGVALYVVGRGQIEVESASGFLTAGVEGLMAEHYRHVISEKTRDALARLRATGRRTSRFPPYGFRLAPGALLVPDPQEQVTLACIATLRASGLSLRAISQKLAAKGILARNGRPFAPMTLARLVTIRPVGDNAATF